MANLPEKNIVTVGKVTSIPSNTNVFINANGEFVQASINDVVKASNVVNDATLNAVKEAIDNQFSLYSGKSILAMTSGGYATDFTAYGASSQKQYSGKNLMPNTATTQTINGVTFTVNEDKSVTVNGTASANAVLVLNSITIKAGSYTLSGCPSGGGYGKYALYTPTSTLADYGNGDTKTLESDASTNVSIVVYKDITVNNLTFYPMIRKSSITDGSYEPYVGGVASPNPTYPQDILSNGHRGYFDGELLNGYYNSADGNYVYQASGRICSKNTIPCKSGDVVKIVLENNVSNMYICYYNESGYISMLYGTENTNSIEKTMPDGATRFTFWAVNSGMTVDTVGHICVTINGMYALIVKNGNKNRLDITKYKGIGNETVTINDNTVTIKAGSYVYGIQFSNADVGLEVGHIYSLSSKVISGTVSGGYRLGFKDGTYGSVLGTNAKITVPKEVSYILYYIGSPYSGTTDVTFGEMQIEESEVQTDYVPHEEQTTYIPIAEPLRGIGEVKDCIKKVDGLYGEGRKFKETIFDGSDDEAWTISGGEGFYTTILNAIAKKSQVCLSNAYSNNGTDTTAWLGKYKIGIGATGALWITDDRFSTVDEWKANLQANPIKVVYELAEETFTPFADQTPFYSMKTFDGVTLISSDAEMEVEVPTSRAGGVASIGYAKGNLAEIELQDIKTKLTELQTAVVSA